MPALGKPTGGRTVISSGAMVPFFMPSISAVTCHRPQECQACRVMHATQSKSRHTSSTLLTKSLISALGIAMLFDMVPAYAHTALARCTSQIVYLSQPTAAEHSLDVFSTSHKMALPEQPIPGHTSLVSR